jgi:hypothetical protein
MNDFERDVMIKDIVARANAGKQLTVGEQFILEKELARRAEPPNALLRLGKYSQVTSLGVFQDRDEGG